MNQIQAWFDLIAGVTQEERARRAFARELFERPPFDLTGLQRPACWRRKPAACRRLPLR